jgi:hypothetical protein
MKVFFGILLGMVGLCVTCCAGLGLLWVGFQLATSPEMWNGPLRLPEFLPHSQAAGWAWSLTVLGLFVIGIFMMRIGFAMFDRTVNRSAPRSISEVRLNSSSERTQRENSDPFVKASSDRNPRAGSAPSSDRTKRDSEGRVKASSDRIRRDSETKLPVPNADQRKHDRRTKTTQNLDKP